VETRTAPGRDDRPRYFGPRSTGNLGQACGDMFREGAPAGIMRAKVELEAAVQKDGSILDIVVRDDQTGQLGEIAVDCVRQHGTFTPATDTNLMPVPGTLKLRIHFVR
jgi:hypothetical protein